MTRGNHNNRGVTEIATPTNNNLHINHPATAIPPPTWAETPGGEDEAAIKWPVQQDTVLDPPRLISLTNAIIAISAECDHGHPEFPACPMIPTLPQGKATESLVCLMVLAQAVSILRRFSKDTATPTP